jgi:hypothetical protein
LLEGSWVYDTPQESPRKEKKEEKEGAHASESGAFNVVYFNETARAAMSSQRPAKFPTGSIIVSEKLSKPDGPPPELLAVMVKRAAGFNAASGDWEFLVVSGALTEVRERQKKGSCIKCHSSQAERDFVFPLSASK